MKGTSHSCTATGGEATPALAARLDELELAFQEYGILDDKIEATSLACYDALAQRVAELEAYIESELIAASHARGSEGVTASRLIIEPTGEEVKT